MDPIGGTKAVSTLPARNISLDNLKVNSRRSRAARPISALITLTKMTWKYSHLPAVSI
jgi:hypothetical protein